MKKTFLFFAMAFFSLNTFSQVSLSGKVIDKETGNGIPFAIVEVKDSDIKTVSQSNGAFLLQITGNNTIEITAKSLGYSSKSLVISPDSFNKEITIMLDAEIYELKTVVVTATRSERKILDVPQRVEVIGNNKIQGIPALSADNYLYSIPGVSISRGASILER